MRKDALLGNRWTGGQYSVVRVLLATTMLAEMGKRLWQEDLFIQIVAGVGALWRCCWRWVADIASSAGR